MRITLTTSAWIEHDPDLAPADAVLGEHPTCGPCLGLPEKLRIVLDPAGLGIDLWMLLLGHAEEGRTLVEEERPRAVPWSKARR